MLSRVQAHLLDHFRDKVEFSHLPGYFSAFEQVPGNFLLMEN